MSSFAVFRVPAVCILSFYQFVVDIVAVDAYPAILEVAFVPAMCGVAVSVPGPWRILS